MTPPPAQRPPAPTATSVPTSRPASTPTAGHAQAATPAPASAVTFRTSGDARTRLLDAALKVLQEQGIPALTQTHVAAAAGLRQSHLTYYFRTRGDLLKAIVEHAARSVCGLVDGRLEAPAACLAELRARLMKDVADTRMPRLMMAMAVASDEDPSLKAWMAQFEQTFLQLLADTLQRLGVRVSAEDLALFHAAMIGISISNASIATQSSAQQARVLVSAALDRLLRAAGTQERPGFQERSGALDHLGSPERSGPLEPPASPERSGLQEASSTQPRPRPGESS